MDKTLNKVAKYISDNALLREHSSVVVGISGGPDSVCLIRILHSLGYEVVAVHCNFHLRGEESQRDEQFTLSLCQRLGIECVKADFDTAEWARQHKMSIEMAARELRYDLFRSVMSEHHSSAIAVGHHKDDNIETMLLNMVRGTGIQGICAIQPRNGDIIRPLLCLSRQEIIHYLFNIGQDFVTDHTNLEDEYSRNKIRLDVLPLLANINPSVSDNLTTTIANLNEVRKVYQSAIAHSIDLCSTTLANGELHISIGTLMKQPSPISVLHELLSPFGFNRPQLLLILANINNCGSIYSSNTGRRLLVDRSSLIVAAEHYPLPELTFSTLNISEVTIQKTPNTAYLDADKVKGKLTIRLPRTADTFAPFGMKGRRKLLSDFLTNLKLTRFEKETQPLLCDGDEIVWVIGRRPSELYRVSNETKKVIVVSVVSQ